MQNTVESINRDRLLSFKHLMERFCVLLKREGVELKPYDGDQPSYFMALPEDRQEAVMHNFERYVGVCVETIAGGWSLKDDAQVLWRMFKALRVHPCNELMASLEEGDIIEIYDASFTQVFRNLAFFSVCSYTLDELLSRPFYELYHRETEVTGHIVDVARGILSGEHTGVYRWTLDQHPVTEIESSSRFHMEVEEKIASALTDQEGRASAILSTLKVLSCVSLVNDDSLRTAPSLPFSTADTQGGRDGA